jgi:hypothetical protein
VAENLPGKTEENHKKSIRTANLLGKTWTLNFLNRQLECYPLDHDI